MLNDPELKSEKQHRTHERPLLFFGAVVLLLSVWIVVNFPMTRLVTTDGNMNDLENRVAGLEQKMNDFNPGQTRKQGDDGERHELERLESSLRNFETDSSTRTRNLETRLDELQARLDLLKGDVASLPKQRAFDRGKTSNPSPARSSSNERTTAKIKTESVNKFHVVGKNETFYSISQSYNISLEKLRALNHFDDKTRIYPGQRIVVGP